MASKWNLIIDVARCDNCRVCFLAVKDEYVGNDFPGYSAAQPVRRPIAAIWRTTSGVSTLAHAATYSDAPLLTLAVMARLICVPMPVPT